MDEQEQVGTEQGVNSSGAAEETPVIPDKAEGKGKLVVLIVGIIVVLLVGGLVTWLVVKSESDKRENNKDTNETVISDDPLWSTADFPKIDASTATQPLALAFYENFTGNKDYKFDDFGFTKTHEAYVKLINKEVDLILVTSPSEDEQSLAKENNMELEVTPVVKEGFVFFVSSDNPIDNLSSDQVRNIYAGNITNWKEVGGEDKPVIAYQRPENSGSQTGILDLVMGGTPMMTPPSESWVMSSMTQIVDAVSSYANTNDAIGYSYYYYAVTMYQEIDKNVADGMKLLSIDGVKPEEKTIQSEEYPFNTAYYIVIDKVASEDSPARKLKEAMLSDRGQKVAQKAQYVPVR